MKSNPKRGTWLCFSAPWHLNPLSTGDAGGECNSDVANLTPSFAVTGDAGDVARVLLVMLGVLLAMLGVLPVGVSVTQMWQGAVAGDAGGVAGDAECVACNAEISWGLNPPAHPHICSLNHWRKSSWHWRCDRANAPPILLAGIETWICLRKCFVFFNFLGLNKWPDQDSVAREQTLTSESKSRQHQEASSQSSTWIAKKFKKTVGEARARRLLTPAPCCAAISPKKA